MANNKLSLNISFNEFSRNELNERLHRFSIDAPTDPTEPSTNCNCNCNCTGNCNCNCNCTGNCNCNCN